MISFCQGPAWGTPHEKSPRSRCMVKCGTRHQNSTVDIVCYTNLMRHWGHKEHMIYHLDLV